MLRSLQNLCSVSSKLKFSKRNLTATEVSTALRPFYFSVHPDLFGQYPQQQATNETSLQQLSAVLQSLQASRPVKPIQLEFFIKDKAKGTLKSIKINIRQVDIRGAVLNILKSLNLPTDYIDKITPPSNSYNPNDFVNLKFKDIDLTKVNKNHPIYAHTVLQRDIKAAQEALKLNNWLENNYKDALEKALHDQPYKDEVERLCKTIAKELQLKEIRWDCGWNASHFKGSLLSFKWLLEHHPEIKNMLKGRNLVFSNFTGVSLDGDIMLYTGEVRHNWLDLIKNIDQYNVSLMRIPAFEKSLSHVLCNIKVGRRKFMPKIVAENYENHLRQITTTLTDYRVKRPYPKSWPKSLEEYEIVVETEAGPLMVSPTGQFIVPSTLPGALLVNFITANLEEALKRTVDYQRDKYIERSLQKEVIEALQLASLNKDDNVTPEYMIDCCTRLLKYKNRLELMKNIHLNIATYYSVLSHGSVCIP